MNMLQRILPFARLHDDNPRLTITALHLQAAPATLSCLLTTRDTARDELAL